MTENIKYNTNAQQRLQFIAIKFPLENSHVFANFGLRPNNSAEPFRKETIRAETVVGNLRMTKLNIRKATETDIDQVWEIFSKVIETGDTYVFNPNSPKSDLKKHWFADYMETYVIEENGLILGTYIIKPNQIDLGNHIANCSYMVSTNAQGKGIGKKLCEHSLKIAKENNFEGIQFNIVVSTNKGAVELWKKYGFEIIGTTPKGFRHSELGLVDTYIMYKDLNK